MKRLAVLSIAVVILALGCGGPPATPPPQPPPPPPVDAGPLSVTGPPPTAAAASPVRFGAIVVTGKVERDAVVQSLHKQADAFHTCATDPKLEGRITLHFDIGKDGRAANTTADRASDIEDKTIQACMVQALQVAMFPIPADGLPAKVIAPILFAPHPSE